MKIEHLNCTLVRVIFIFDLSLWFSKFRVLTQQWQIKQKVIRYSAPQVTAPRWTAPARPPDLWLRPWKKMCFHTTGSVPWRTFPIRSTSPSTWPWWEFWELWVRTPAFSFIFMRAVLFWSPLRHVSLAECNIPNPDNAYMASSGTFSVILCSQYHSLSDPFFYLGSCLCRWHLFVISHCHISLFAAAVGHWRTELGCARMWNWKNFCPSWEYLGPRCAHCRIVGKKNNKTISFFKVCS